MQYHSYIPKFLLHNQKIEYFYLLFYTTKMNTNIMLSVKLKLETIPIKEQDADFKEIHSQVKKYLSKHCKHIIIEDLIDLDADTSRIVRYCRKCETCFPSSLPIMSRNVDWSKLKMFEGCLFDEEDYA
jgi:hypothetical protein